MWYLEVTIVASEREWIGLEAALAKRLLWSLVTDTAAEVLHGSHVLSVRHDPPLLARFLFSILQFPNA
jgi:hypothetical protein